MPPPDLAIVPSEVGAALLNLSLNRTFACLQELKAKIATELGYPLASQRLYLKNQELEEDLEMKDLVSDDCLDPLVRLGKWF